MFSFKKSFIFLSCFVFSCKAGDEKMSINPIGDITSSSKTYADIFGTSTSSATYTILSDFVEPDSFETKNAPGSKNGTPLVRTPRHTSPADTDNEDEKDDLSGTETKILNGSANKADHAKIT